MSRIISWGFLVRCLQKIRKQQCHTYTNVRFPFSETFGTLVSPQSLRSSLKSSMIPFQTTNPTTLPSNKHLLPSSVPFSFKQCRMNLLDTGFFRQSSAETPNANSTKQIRAICCITGTRICYIMGNRYHYGLLTVSV